MIRSVYSTGLTVFIGCLVINSETHFFARFISFFFLLSLFC